VGFHVHFIATFRRNFASFRDLLEATFGNREAKVVVYVIFVDKIVGKYACSCYLNGILLIVTEVVLGDVFF